MNNNNTVNELKAHYKSPIKRTKSLQNLTKSLNNNQNEIYNHNLNKRKNPKEDQSLKMTTTYRIDYGYDKNNPKNSYPRYSFNDDKNQPRQNKLEGKALSQKNSSTRNVNKLNDLYKRKRNSSVKNNGESAAENYFYKLICNNCYNNKIATKNLKEQPVGKKEKLNKTFNKVNPFYFQDKMKEMQKEKIDKKIKELEKLQKQALDKLAKYKSQNPSDKEKLQKENEYSINPLNDCEKEDPRSIKAKINYDNKENFINKNKDLYQIDKPRKAINDYYNKCIYQVPVLEEEYHVDPEYKKEVNKELKKQIEEKKNNKRKKKDEEIKEEKDANKKMNEYLEYVKKKNKEEKNKKYEEICNKNKILNDFKKNKEKEEKESTKKYYNEFNKKMKVEDEKKKEKNRQKKLNDINKLQNWLKEFEDIKNDKKKEEKEENDKWNNYAKEFSSKCKHGLDVSRCAICNKIFPKEKLIKYYPSSTDVSKASSKRNSIEK